MDSGLYAGMNVPLYYDPLLAKLICWGEDRLQAIERMRRAVDEYTISGVRTTLPFVAWLLRHPRFIGGDFSTDFIAQEWHPEDASAGTESSNGRNAAGAHEDELAKDVIAALAAALTAQDWATAAAMRRRPHEETVAEQGSHWRAAGRRAAMKGGW
jgi:acetyl/propionyl-CoA carboxylase alpha subunit